MHDIPIPKVWSNVARYYRYQAILVGVLAMPTWSAEW